MEILYKSILRLIEAKGESLCDNNLFKGKCKRWVATNSEVLTEKVEYIDEILKMPAGKIDLNKVRKLLSK